MAQQRVQIVEVSPRDGLQAEERNVPTATKLELLDRLPAAGRARVAAAPLIPPGRFMAIDAAAWRWISGRPVVVTPADLGPCAISGVSYSAVKWLVLERAHFSAYEPLFRGALPPDYLGPPQVVGDIRIYALDLQRATALCESGQ